MKKEYVICCFLIGITGVIVAFTSYFISRNVNDNKNNNETTAATTQSVADTSSTEVAITTKTRIVCEKFYINNSKLEKGALTEFSCLGLTKKQLQERINNYMNNPSVSDLSEGLVAFEIIEFSNKEVILRKTYNNTNTFTGRQFYLTFENDYIVVYLGNKTTLYDYTGISRNSLPDNVANEIQQGKYVDSVEELYEFLENYSS